MQNLCPQCGAPAEAGSNKCQYCGAAIEQAPVQTQQPQVQQIFVQQSVANPAIKNTWPIKNKLVAAILALFLGGLGVHKFYLGDMTKGVIYLIFCWTSIPAFIGFIEGILMLVSNDENFQLKYKCRLEK